VERVDAASSEIVLRPISGRSRVVTYSAETRVMFRGREYPVTRLESGAEAEQQLKPARRQNTLASAVIDARRGDYEPARQAASDFFTSLRAETERGNESALSQAQRDGVQALFKQRDEIITLLARGDPAAADRLSDLYVSYRKIMKEGGTSVKQKS
jgi:hypothetical protein